MHHHNKNCEQDGDEQTFGPRISFHPPSTLSSLSPSQHLHRASAASSVSPPGVWPPEVSTSRHSGKKYNTVSCRFQRAISSQTKKSKWREPTEERRARDAENAFEMSDESRE